MLDIRNAVASLTARCDLPGSWYRILPPLSSTRRIRTGVRSVPSFAKAPYAAVSDSRVTSPAPSARDGTLGGVPTLSFWAYDTAAGVPIVFSLFTPARMLDLRR